MASKLEDNVSPIIVEKATEETPYWNDAVHAQMNSEICDSMISQTVTRVLLIYTGGTIGMKNTHNGYVPVKDYFENSLKQATRFHDDEFFSQMDTKTNTTFVCTADKDFNSILVNGSSVKRVELPTLITPASLYEKRIRYSILEYDPLLDSSNMTMQDWVKIATDIEVNYRLYDAFIVLHGTDTMAYTASALSFMLENLGKTVIITGSQVPLNEFRNDAVDNLLNALTIAGHFVIPEVSLCFDNKLFRGNRCSKVNAIDFAAFDSPNLRPLVTISINIDVSWLDVWKPSSIHRFKAHKIMQPSVATLRLFPSITEETVRAFLSPPICGVVLETYGSGNAPSNRPELLESFKEACDRGVVIVNCSQCKKGLVTDIYATGKALLKIGIVPGADMTPECALTKLSYLLGKYRNSADKVRYLMRKSLRGEITVPNRRMRFTYLPNAQGLTASVLGILGITHTNSSLITPDNKQIDDCFSEYTPDSSLTLEKQLVPLLLCQAAISGDVKNLEIILSTFSHLINMPDYDGRTPLHIAASEGKLAAVKYLLMNGASIHLKDRFGNSPLMDALRFGHEDVVILLKKGGAFLSPGLHNLIFLAEQEHICAKLCKVCATGDTRALLMLINGGADISLPYQDRRTPLHLAAFYGHTEIVKILVKNICSVDVSLSDLMIRSPGSSPCSENLSMTKTASESSLKNGRYSPKPSAISCLQPLDAFGRTPLQEAQEKNYTDIVQIIRKAIDDCV